MSETPSIHEIEHIVQLGIEQIRKTRVGRLLDVYDAMLAQTDSTCPRWFSNPDGIYWADTCTSETEVSFQGFATSIPRNDVVPDDYGNLFTGRQIRCEGTLRQGDTTMECVGGINELTGTDSNGHDVFTSYLGSRTDPRRCSGTFPQCQNWAVHAPTYKALFQMVCTSCAWNIGVEIGGIGQQTMSNVNCLIEPNGTQNVQVNGEWVYVGGTESIG